MALINYSAIFNGVDLTTITGLTVISNNAYVPPKRTLASAVLARTDKSKTTSAFWESREITIRVSISRLTRALLEQSIDALMLLLVGIEKELRVSQSNTNRRYICTLADMMVNHGGGSYCEIDLIFNCSDRYGYDLGLTTLLYSTGLTNQSRTDPITPLGSAEWQAPIITVTYSVATGATLKDVMVGNSATGQQITVNRTWVAGDSLQIDALERTVKVNGVEVDFSGAFPEFRSGQVGYWSYADTFTARTFIVSIRYYKRWV